jgi:hypothetical protein
MHPGSSSRWSLIDDEHRSRIPQLLDDVRPQVVPYGIRVPVGRRQQPLQAVRGPLAGLLGELPTVLALHRPGQPAQVSQGAAPRFGAPKPGADPSVERPQSPAPRRNLVQNRALRSRGKLCRVLALSHDSSCPSLPSWEFYPLQVRL